MNAEKTDKTGENCQASAPLRKCAPAVAATGKGAGAVIDVLVAEDEPGILESLDFILRRAGWSISTVTDGEAALEAARQLHPRVVVLDLMLPKRTGFEVLKQMKADKSTRDVPILILTAKGQQRDRQIAEELGADGFVTKPYANDDVIGAVRRLLEGTKA
ncbi:MAG TPA: response regulator [Xanthobacteraceae bacterium]|nr:response regulator [Xanthobacteraceae bacterium]